MSKVQSQELDGLNEMLRALHLAYLFSAMDTYLQLRKHKTLIDFMVEIFYWVY